MTQSEPLPFVLTLKLDQKTFAYFNQLRQQHFPVDRNFLPAHITLFHALPAEKEESIQRVLQTLCTHASPLKLTFQQPRFLGKGVAIEVNCPELVQLQQTLAKAWRDQLTRQDQQGYHPHITIQNKVSADNARSLYKQLVKTWKPFPGTGEGLLLWRYLGGPWELIREFKFTS